MLLAPGTKCGPYEIRSLLGKGGMGEVYRAHDGKLEREIAIKALPEEFARDPERLSRFEREAKLLAQLNHPNIASIYGLEESSGARDGRFLMLKSVAASEQNVAPPQIVVVENWFDELKQRISSR